MKPRVTPMVKISVMMMIMIPTMMLKVKLPIVAQRIPGWGKVAALAKTMINLDRLSVSQEYPGTLWSPERI